MTPEAKTEKGIQQGKHPDILAVIDDTVKNEDTFKMVTVESPEGEKIQMIEIKATGYELIGENSAGVVVERNGIRTFLEPTSVDFSDN